MIRLFRGGIHPYGKKESTRKKSLIPAVSPPSRIILPLCTPTDDILNPVVAVGDVVKLGQMVAQVEEGDTVPLYSGVSGTVTKIGLEPHPLFEKAPAIVISNDFKNTETQLYSYDKPETLRPEQIMDMLCERGVRGMSRQERPVHLKLAEHRGKIDTLILNGVECEPYITADYRLILDRLEMVIRGSQILAQCLEVSRLVFAVQGDKLDAMESLESSPLWNKETMSVQAVPTRYPYGEEKQVIRLVTGQELPKGSSSLQGNCVVFNIATAFAVGEAILKGKPQTHRVVTVSGAAVKRPRNIWIPIGSPLESVFVNGEGMKEEAQILLGGPMTGLPQRDLRAPLLVSSSALLALSKQEIPKHLWEGSPPSTMPCIGCGHCLPVCPMHLMPNVVYRHMNKTHQNPAILAKFQPKDCIACGCCNYRCPSHLPLAQTMADAELVVAAAQVRARERAMELAQQQEAQSLCSDKVAQLLGIPTLDKKGNQDSPLPEIPSLDQLETPSQPSSPEKILPLEEEEGEVIILVTPSEDEKGDNT